MARAFGDIRALRGVLALVGNQSESVNAIFDGWRHGRGCDKAFGAVASTPAQKFARFGAAIEAVKIAIGVGLAPALSDAAVAMTKWLGNADNQKALTDAFKDTADALKDVVGFAKDASDKLGGLKEVAKLVPLLGFLQGAENHRLAASPVGCAGSSGAVVAGAA